MNLLQKISAISNELRVSEMTGKAKSSQKGYGFDYIQNKDFLPCLNQLLWKYRVIVKFQDFSEYCCLTIIDCETKEEEMYQTITPPIGEEYRTDIISHPSKGELRRPKGFQQTLQAYASREAYLKRRILLQVFNVAVEDGVDV